MILMLLVKYTECYYENTWYTTGKRYGISGFKEYINTTTLAFHAIIYYYYYIFLNYTFLHLFYTTTRFKLSLFYKQCPVVPHFNFYLVVINHHRSPDTVPLRVAV